MRHPILFAVLLGVAAPLVAQDDVGQGGRTVTDEITATSGEEIYRVLCQGCHQPDGSGAIGAGDYPALAGSPNLEFPAYAVSVVLNGHGAMPPFGDLLDDQQVAAVVRFIQTHWGNETETEASVEQVDSIRP